MVQPVPPPVQVGDVIAGKYRVERTLGTGGMGVVVAARHVDLDELRAIKLMNPAELRNAKAIERFRQEARVAARLKSEHAARIFDIETPRDGSAFIVMEHLEGMDLHALLQYKGAQPIDLAALYIVHTCDAVAEAHAAGVVHRDLKLANLFLTTRANGSPCVKVLDFGLSKLARSQSLIAQQAPITTTQEVFGTPFYMSPEQMKASHDVDARADVWALGVILYELVTGKRAFQGSTYAEIASYVLRGDPPPPSSLRQDVPWNLERVILRCLEKERNRRVPSAGELMRELLPFAATFSPGGGLRISDKAPAEKPEAVRPPNAPSLSSRRRKRRGAHAADNAAAPPDPYAPTVPQALRLSPILPPPAGKRSSEPAGPAPPPVSKRPSEPAGPVRKEGIQPRGSRQERDSEAQELLRPRLGPLQLAHKDFRGHDLSGRNLAGADLTGADLSNATLVGADLRGAVLRDANLAGADLSSACLLGADLMGAKLDGARFCLAKLVGARISAGALATCDTFGAALPEPPWIEGNIAPASPCEAIAMHPSGLLLASVHGDGSARLWNLTKGLLLRVLPRAADVRSAAFSADGRLLATGHADGSILVWNLGTGVVDQRANVSASVLCIAFSPDTKVRLCPLERPTASQ